MSRNDIDTANHRLIENLEPKKVFQIFADISAIPRGSGNIQEISDWLVKFAESRGLEVHQGKKTYGEQEIPVPNVIIRKNGTPGSKSSERVALQAHMDMVCTQRGDSHDFNKDPIEFILDGNKLHANNTTLGADDGIGVAIALAILDSDDLVHPPLEVVITVDEETDMKGAKMIGPDDMESLTLINIDAEDIGLAFTSCAAGCSMYVDLPIKREPVSSATFYKIEIAGLLGGHSGLEINQGRANAFVLLARLLQKLASGLERPGQETIDGIEFGLHTFQKDSDVADNAIPNQAGAIISLASPSGVDNLRKAVIAWNEIFRTEFVTTDKDVTVSVVELKDFKDSSGGRLTTASRDNFLRTLVMLPLGVRRVMQNEIQVGKPYLETLVETSCNLGIVELQPTRAHLNPLARSSSDSCLDEIVSCIQGLATMAGGVYTPYNTTAGWEPASPPTDIQLRFARLEYGDDDKKPKQKVKLVGVHAGLECGCIIETFKNVGKKMEAIAIGPQIYGAHSPDETLLVDTVKPIWNQITGVLKDIADGVAVKKT